MKAALYQSSFWAPYNKGKTLRYFKGILETGIVIAPHWKQPQSVSRMVKQTVETLHNEINGISGKISVSGTYNNLDRY